MESRANPPSPAQPEGDPSDTLRLPRVRQRTGLGRSTIYRMMAQGLFPNAVQLTPRAVGWRKADIDTWLATRPRARH